SHYQIACHVRHLFIWRTLNLNSPDKSKNPEHPEHPEHPQHPGHPPKPPHPPGPPEPPRPPKHRPVG
ncbi:hypothetical protein KA005_34135, partial [bacterium]|nr:hypothetical protein [bacterium]